MRKLLLPLALLLSACSDSTDPAAPPEQVVVDAATLSGTVGSLVESPISVRVLDSGGEPVENVPVGWTASHGGSVTPTSRTDAAGIARAQWTLGGVAGEQAATATVEGVSPATIRAVAMPGVPSRIMIEPDTATMHVGQVLELVGSVTDRFGNTIPSTPISWSSGSTEAATVDASGVVTAVRPDAAAVITATWGSLEATSRLTITRAPVVVVTVSPESLDIDAGESRQLRIRARDANGLAVDDRAATWTSSDTAVARVSAEGVVTGIAVGTATVSSTIDGTSGSAQVTVRPFSTRVSGRIQQNTTWTRDRSPYDVSSVVVPEGVTLTIEPGVRVVGIGGIEVYGTLEARGSGEDPVVFDDVGLGAHADGAHIGLAHVRSTEGAITINRGTITVVDSHFERLTLLDVRVPTGDTRIERNSFHLSGRIGLELRAGTRAVIRNNHFSESRFLGTNEPSVAIFVTGREGEAAAVIEHNTFLDTHTVVLALNLGVQGTLVARDNFWSTTDPRAIEAMIFDGHDGEGGSGTVEYTPFLSQPHALTPNP